MAMTKKMTKKDIEDYNQTLQQQILGLQQELTEKSLLLHDAETRVNAFERISEDADGVRDQLRYERNVTYKLSTMVDGLARQFMWSLTMMDSILLYTPEDTNTRQMLMKTLKSEVAPFVEEFQGHIYNAETLQAHFDQGRSSNIFDDSDLMTTILESDVPPTDQEVPDEVPHDAYEYVADPDFGLHRIDAKDR
jgi:uncharacterized protein YukE